MNNYLFYSAYSNVRNSLTQEQPQQIVASFEKNRSSIGGFLVDKGIQKNSLLWKAALRVAKLKEVCLISATDADVKLIFFEKVLMFHCASQLLLSLLFDKFYRYILALTFLVNKLVQHKLKGAICQSLNFAHNIQ